MLIHVLREVNVARLDRMVPSTEAASSFLSIYDLDFADVSDPALLLSVKVGHLCVR